MAYFDPFMVGVEQATAEGVSIWEKIVALGRRFLRRIRRKERIEKKEITLTLTGKTVFPYEIKVPLLGKINVPIEKKITVTGEKDYRLLMELLDDEEDYEFAEKDELLELIVIKMKELLAKKKLIPNDKNNEVGE